MSRSRVRFRSYGEEPRERSPGSGGGCVEIVRWYGVARLVTGLPGCEREPLAIFSRIDGTFEPMRNGKVRLVGVAYLINATQRHATNADPWLHAALQEVDGVLSG